jgi:hypothetical protein
MHHRSSHSGLYCRYDRFPLFEQESLHQVLVTIDMLKTGKGQDNGQENRRQDENQSRSREFERQG